MFGWVLEAAALFMVGPSIILNYPHSLFLIVSGLFICGLVNPFICLPGYGEMTAAFLENKNQMEFDENSLSNVISALYNAGLSAGVIIAPLFGSYLELEFDYRMCCDIIALTTLAYTFLYIAVIYI
jgi:MFS family permease